MRSDTPRWPAIAILGAYPPPFGGVSVPMERLKRRLEQDGFDFCIYNTVSEAAEPPHVVSIARGRVAWYLRFAAVHRCRVVHLITTSWPSYLLFALAAALRPGRYVLSLQNMVALSDRLRHPASLGGRLACWVLRQVDVVIACNEEIERQCIEIAGLDPARVRRVPAFIAPDPELAPALPDFVRGFLESHEPRLFAATWAGFVYEGADLYGIDLLIELVARLRREHPRVGLVMTVLGGPPDAMRRAVETARERAGDAILVITEPLADVARLMQGVDLFLRPTNTDGDSVSIREALYLGTPVVTSDAISRPAPCVLFRNRDAADFEAKVRDALARRDALRAAVASHPKGDYVAPICELYRELLAQG